MPIDSHRVGTAGAVHPVGPLGAAEGQLRQIGIAPFGPVLEAGLLDRPVAPIAMEEVVHRQRLAGLQAQHQMVARALARQVFGRDARPELQHARRVRPIAVVDASDHVRSVAQTPAIGVVAGDADQNVVAGAAGENVMAAIALEPVVARTPRQHILAAATFQMVGPKATQQRVIPVTAPNGIIAAAAIDVIGAIAAC